MSHKTNLIVDILSAYLLFTYLLTYLPADQTFRNLSHETLQNCKEGVEDGVSMHGIGRGEEGQLGSRGTGV